MLPEFRQLKRCSRWTAALLSLVTAGVLLASVSLFGTTFNQRPTVSPITDQTITDTDNNQFDPVYFRAWDKETDPLPSPTPIMENEAGNSNFMPPGSAHINPCNSQSDSGCPPDHGYKVTFDRLTNGDGEATIVIIATDASGATGRSSFTLRKQSGAVNPPVLAGIPNEQITLGTGFAYGPVWFVIDDLDSIGVDDTLGLNGQPTVVPSGTSDNHDVVLDEGIAFTWLGGLKWSVKVTPKVGAIPGTAVITITATDSSDFRALKTSTSFVLDVIDTTSNQAPPSFTAAPSPSGTWIEHNVTQSDTAIYHFKVTDSQTQKSQLLVTATSSNGNLVPNDFANNLMVTQPDSSGVGTVTIKPVLPLPSPSPGVPQAATITLSVTDPASPDTSYTRREQFLYVAKNPDFSALSFSRPTGVYNLNVDACEDHRSDSFLTGAMHQISWKCVEPSQDTWNWWALDEVFSNLPDGQDLSINLIEEPGYIADQQHQPHATDTWCDTSHIPFDCPVCSPSCSPSCTPLPSPSPLPTCPPIDGQGQPGIFRALPWDSYLQQRRNIFLQALANHQLPNGKTVAQESHITIINPNLFGGDTGIRELNGVPFSPDTFQNYRRENLLAALQTELRTIMNLFPGKLVHIGFFIVEDNQDSNYGNVPLWYWLYSQLTSEFNGTRKPRVNFFQEDLAATRASAAPDYIPYVVPSPTPMQTAYTFTPGHCQLPSFAYPCGGNVLDCGLPDFCSSTLSPYNNGITFQANTSWTSPAMPNPDNDNKVQKTLNSSPNDGLEAAFNNYLSEYLEVYRGDLDHALQPPPTPSPTPWDAPKWADGLQSWKEYFDHLRGSTPLDAPAGLTVARQSATNNIVSWYGVYRATSYTLQRKSLYPPGSWSNVSGCDSTSTTCTDTASTGSRYAYRVQASNADGNPPSPWAQVAVFVSEPAYDGYVTVDNGTSTPFSNAAQPGIQAGQGSNSNLSGFVSFDTGILTAGVTVLDAKLRLKQYTSNGGFDVLGPCVVDIRKGPYNNNEALEADDFDALETDMDVTPDVALTGVDTGNWVEAELDADYISDINTTDRTQFRLWFPQVQGAGEQLVGWYSGESTGSEPHLVVQYAGP